MWILRTLVIIILITLIVGFAIYNSDERISVNLYGKQYFDIPMIFVAFWALVVGMLISFALGVGYYFKMYSELRNQRRENRKLLEEITALRNLPLEEEEER
ncbi:MAG: LapA family protein [candidate division Zixibacteria bacterium]|nr:LapA family protein [candidate division Zixibacteria bacterium]